MATPGLAFKEWAASENLVTSAPIEQLSRTKVIIDAEDYLESLLTAAATREPLLPALGGLPFALKRHVNDHLANFKAAEIDVQFHFNGLDVACKDRSHLALESRQASESLNEAWLLYSRSEAAEAVQEFGKSCTYRTYHVSRWLQAYLRKSGHGVHTGPYSAAAQAVCFKESGFGQAVAGSASCLMFGAHKVIVNFDWDNKSFSWIEKSKLLSKLGLTDDQFVDLCLLSGVSILSPMPDVEESPFPNMQAAVTILSRVNNDGYSACMQAKNAEYTLLYKKAKTAVRHMVVQLESGDIQPMNNDTVPADLHEVISQRLPLMVLHYLTRGVIGSRMLNWRTRMEIFELAPLDGGDSAAYRDLVLQKLSPMRTRALALMTQHLNRYYQKKDVEVSCWFNENTKKSLNVPDAEPGRKMDKWRVTDKIMSESDPIKDLDFTTSPLLLVTKFLSDKDSAAKTLASGNKEELESSKEFVTNSVWRLFQDRGYINDEHTLTSLGKAYLSALEHAKSSGLLAEANSTSEVEEAIFITFELLRLDALNLNQMFPASQYSGAPMRGSETDKSYALLLSRIACLGTFKHQEIGFTGPLSRHLLAYQQMIAAVRGSLRDLLEMHGLHMLLSNTFRFSLTPGELADFGARMPFGREQDLGLSLVVKNYLDELSNGANRRADITIWFSYALDIPGDLERMWKLWAAINTGVQATDKSALNDETRSTFKKVDEWLQEKLQSAAAPTTNEAA